MDTASTAESNTGTGPAPAMGIIIIIDTFPPKHVAASVEVVECMVDQRVSHPCAVEPTWNTVSKF